jgi:hypothetical protein
MTVRHARRSVRDFTVHSLTNEAVSLAIVPELGGRLVSLRDRASGREWLDGWSPAGRRRIWHPTDPSDFATGPGAGIDECLPTVLPCRVGGRDLPDHGELWNRPPVFDPSAAANGEFLCEWALRSLPLGFRRRITLEGRRVRFDYRIEIFVPAEKRIWGYYVYPLLEGDRMIGRLSVKADRNTGCLTVESVRHLQQRHQRRGVPRRGHVPNESVGRHGVRAAAVDC